MILSALFWNEFQKMNDEDEDESLEKKKEFSALTARWQIQQAKPEKKKLPEITPQIERGKIYKLLWRS